MIRGLGRAPRAPLQCGQDARCQWTTVSTTRHAAPGSRRRLRFAAGLSMFHAILNDKQPCHQQLTEHNKKKPVRKRTLLVIDGVRRSSMINLCTSWIGVSRSSASRQLLGLKRAVARTQQLAQQFGGLAVAALLLQQRDASGGHCGVHPCRRVTPYEWRTSHRSAQKEDARPHDQQANAGLRSTLYAAAGFSCRNDLILSTEDHVSHSQAKECCT